jgi:hypothetical protein
MLGYIVWTTDRLTALARANTTTADPGRKPDQRPPATAGHPHDAGDASGVPGAFATRHQDQGGRPALAPKLAACGKIAMSITMGYMLILML